MIKCCANCVMDETDPKISFNNSGFCNHCLNFYKNIEPFLKNENERRQILEKNRRN